MIVNWDPLLKVLRRPILGRALHLMGATLFGASLGLTAALVSHFLVRPFSSSQFAVAVGGFAFMGFCYGVAIIARIDRPGT